MNVKPVIKSFILFPLNILYRISPKTELKILFKLKHGYKLNLKEPKTFSEKIQVYKLIRDQRFVKLTDKYTVREYVKTINPEILNALLWDGFNPNLIPFDNLPNSFVIKVTHGSGLNIICKDKSKLDRKRTIKTLKKWLKFKYLPCYGEWFYGVEKPRIIIEEFLNPGNGKEPTDYKVFCFDGKPLFIREDLDRFGNHKTNFYDVSWNLLDVSFGNPRGEPTPKPNLLNEMLKCAAELSSGFSHVRVDFYIVNNKLYFGEMTFTSGGGFDKVTPLAFDYEIGKYFNLDSLC